MEVWVPNSKLNWDFLLIFHWILSCFVLDIQLLIIAKLLKNLKTHWKMRNSLHVTNLHQLMKDMVKLVFHIKRHLPWNQNEMQLAFLLTEPNVIQNNKRIYRVSIFIYTSWISYSFNSFNKRFGRKQFLCPWEQTYQKIIIIGCLLCPKPYNRDSEHQENMNIQSNPINVAILKT